MLLGPFRVLGTASRFVSARMGNLRHERTLPFGDPPCGTFAIASSLPPGAQHPRRPVRFGKVGALVLVATGGEALDAVSHGRERLVLHGGKRDKRRRLRRTRGGLRVGNRNLLALFAAINRAQADGDPLSVIEIVDVTHELDQMRALPPARRRRERRSDRHVAPVAAPRAASMAGVAVAAMTLFGVRRASPTRRAFLATALLAVTGGRLLTACDRPDPCPSECEAEYGSGSGSGSGSGTRPRPGSAIGRRATGSGSGSGSGSGTDPVEACIEACEEDYTSGGGVG